MEILKICLSAKVLRNKAFNIVINTNFDGYQRGIASMVYKIFEEKSGDTTQRETGTFLIQSWRINNQQENCTSQLLENFKSVKCICS